MAALSKLPGDSVRGLLAVVDQGFVSLNNFVTFILVAQFCSDRDVNLYVLAWSIVNVFRVVQERALATPYFVFAHSPERDQQTLLGSSLFQQLVFGIVSGVTLLSLAICGGSFSSFGDLAVSLFVLAAAAPAILLRDHLRAISCAHFRNGVAVLLSVSALVLQIVGILVAYWAGILNVGSVFVVMGLASLVPAVCWLVLRPEPFRIDVRRLSDDWRATFGYSKWLVAARFFPSAAMGLLPWIVMWMIDEDGAGIWGACLTLANISNMFVFGANYFFLPRTVQALKTRGVVGMGRVLWQAAIVFTVVLSALCVFYLFCGGFVLKSAFGERFEPYAVLTAVIGLSFLVVSYSTVAGNGMTALGRPEGLFWGELAFGIVCVVGGAFLSKTMGLNGTALGLCLASLTATIVESAYLKGVAASARYTAK